MGENETKQVFAGRYELREQIGSGGGGVVHVAMDLQLHRLVAIKQLRMGETNHKGDTEKLWREATTLAAIQHPNIVTIFDSGVDESGPYVVMEYLDGETLDEVVARGPYGIESFVEAVPQILEALIAAHATGLVHRDLKPQNIMVKEMPSGALQYKILDFGLAKFQQSPSHQTMDEGGGLFGSVMYMAPEQLSKKPLDARTDLYAIGCVFYFMLSGKHAFDGGNVNEIMAAHLQHRVMDIRVQWPSIPEGLARWIMKMINRNPEHRHQSAVEALRAFQLILTDITVPMMPVDLSDATPDPKPVPKTSVPHIVVPRSFESMPRIASKQLIATLLIVLGCGGGIAAFLSQRDREGREVAVRGKLTANAMPASVPASVAKLAPKIHAVSSLSAAASNEARKSDVERTAEHNSAPPTPAVTQASSENSQSVFQTADLEGLKKAVGSELTIEGKVHHIGESRGGKHLYVDFSSAAHDAASIMINVTDASRSTFKGKLQTFVGKTIRASGKLEEYKGDLQIRIAGPDAIELR